MGTTCSIPCDYSSFGRLTDPAYKGSRRRRTLQGNELSLQDILNNHRFSYFEKFSHTDIKDVYVFENKVGRGHFGQVYVAHSRFDSSRKFAVKTINKGLMSDISITRLQQELDILEKIDHPNLIKYQETFVDHQYIHIVMELCTGGELFHKIDKERKLTESQAAKITYQILSAVKHLHANGVCHRDLKPENIMFTDQDQDEIKIIDFGLSKLFNVIEMNSLNSIVGTPYYIAPETLSSNYDYRCDVWSIGVILYIMLCGYPPFNAKTSKEVLSKIKRGKLVFCYEDWQNISKDAQDLVSCLLQIDLGDRITIDEALNHPWFSKNLSQSRTTLSSTLNSTIISIEEVDKSALVKLVNIGEIGILQQEILQFLTRNLQNKDLEPLTKSFMNLDSYRTGMVSLDDFKLAMQDSDIRLDDCAIEAIFSKINVSERGFIYYSEFIAAAIRQQDYISSKDIKYCFQTFDTDNDGYISASDLQEIYQRRGKQKKLQELQSMIDEHTHERKITYELFCRIINDLIR